jgi:hypothetical protein
MFFGRRNRRCAQHRGFSLFDVLISIVVMTIGFAGLSAMQLVSLRTGQAARELSEATQLGRAKAEELGAVPPPLPASPTGGELLDARGCRLTGDTRRFCLALLPGARYTRSWLYDPAQSTYSVDVSWKDGMGHGHKVVIIGRR